MILPRHALGLLVALLGACTGESTTEIESGAGTIGSESVPPAVVGRVEAMLRAEIARDIAAINAEHGSDRDVLVRRAAARALARMRNPKARELLLRGLFDEDDEVVAWSAYGLGDICGGSREETVGALVATATARLGAPVAPRRTTVDPMRAIARSIGRCAALQSEPTLVSWARQRSEHAVDAIYALGDIARKHKRLREDTCVTLLEIAEGDASTPPEPEALYPLGLVEHLTPSVIERTRVVASARLADAGVGRAFAVRALGRTDDAAVPVLVGVLEDPAKFNANERTEAARALTRFGRAGQRALSAALRKMVPSTEPVASTALVSPDMGPMLATMNGLTDLRKAKSTLKKIARLSPPPEAPKPVLRRLSWLRCTAAKLLAERDYTRPELRACDLEVSKEDQAADPITSSIGARAVVAAIGVDGVKIRRARLEAWRSYADGGDVRARQAALQLLAGHDEIRQSAEVLAKALTDESPGIVATAAEVIAAHPSRAIKRRKRSKKRKGDDRDKVVAAELDQHLVEALVARLDAVGPTEDLEALGGVIDAVGALSLGKAKERLVELCKSPHRKTREHTERALGRIMGKASPSCDKGSAVSLPSELERRLTGVTTVNFETDVGQLTLRLDPTFAPLAVTRAVELAKNGFYDGMVVHRVVPGFVSQFGSPTFDGYGGVKGMLPLPCETSPISYASLRVGVALSGRDTGSSQLFVTHAPTPHLDGQHAIIGEATGPWDALIDGDVIQRATVTAE